MARDRSTAAACSADCARAPTAATKAKATTAAAIPNFFI